MLSQNRKSDDARPPSLAEALRGKLFCSGFDRAHSRDNKPDGNHTWSFRRSISIFVLAAACNSFVLTVAAVTAPVNLTAVAVGQTQINLSWGGATDDVWVTGYLVERCQGSNCTDFVQIATVTPTGITGPLTVSTNNPRYFADPNGRTLLLGGSHHWNNFIDSGTVSPPPAFDYDAYLDFMSTNHHNFFRLWALILPKMNYTIQDAGPWYQFPQPWLRTGPGNATDGLPKFDLSQFNQAYFDRMRLRVQEANAREIYVSIMLFDGYHVQFDRRPDDGYPLTGANNINGVNDGGGTRSHDLALIPGAVLTAEENYVRKVIDTVNDLPNVLYEIANEAGGYSVSWQEHFIALIHNYEAGKALQHPVGFTFPSEGGTDNMVYSSDAEWVSPLERFPSNDGTRHVIQNDTDHSYFWTGMKADGAQLNRAFVWKNFTAGNSAMFMDPYLMPWTASGNTRNSPGGCVSGPSCTVVDPVWNPVRKNIGYMLDYANGKLDLVKMTPQGNLASTGYCLANAASTGAEYLIYAPVGGSFTVNLSATTQSLTVEWLNPSTGVISPGGTVNGGSSAQSFTPPFGDDAVLYLVDLAGHTIQAAGGSYDDAGLATGASYRYRVRATDADGNLSGYSSEVSATTRFVLLAVPSQTINQIAQSGFRFFLSANSAATYHIESTTNFVSWQQIATVQYTNGQVEVVDSNANQSAARFYRAVSGP